MENQFKELANKLKEAGFVAYWKESPSGHPYMIAGSHEINNDVKLIQNAVMVTQDNNLWMIQTTWPDQVDQDFFEQDFSTMVEKTISLLSSRK